VTAARSGGPRPGPGPGAAWLIVPIGLVTALGVVGSALTPTLAAHHPLVLIALEARDRNLLLARHVAFPLFFVVGSLRRFSSDPLYYLLGRRHGDAAVRWLDRQGGGAIVRITEAAFRRAAYPMLVIFPGAVVCALAGEVGIPPVVFVTVTVLRTFAAVALIRVLSEAFSGPVDAVLHFFDRTSLPATVVSVVLVVAWLLWERRRRGRGGDPTPPPAGTDHTAPA
jgi:membrane protein DedA with SNARE-associated domain